MLTKDNNYKVMGLFFGSPEKEFHIRQISRMTGLSAPGVAKIVCRLKKEGLLSSRKNGIVENVFAAKTGKFLRLKACHNFIALHECGLVDFLRDEYEEPEAIVLFGSFAKGEDTSKSDIDIAIVTGAGKEPGLKKFERALGRKINIYQVKLDECREDFLNSLANGRVLHGYLRMAK